ILYEPAPIRGTVGSGARPAAGGTEAGPAGSGRRGRGRRRYPERPVASPAPRPGRTGRPARPPAKPGRPSPGPPRRRRAHARPQDRAAPAGRLGLRTSRFGLSTSRLDPAADTPGRKTRFTVRRARYSNAHCRRPAGKTSVKITRAHLRTRLVLPRSFRPVFPEVFPAGPFGARPSLGVR